MQAALDRNSLLSLGETFFQQWLCERLKLVSYDWRVILVVLIHLSPGIGAGT